MSKWTLEKFPLQTRVRVYATLNGACVETKGTVTRYRETDGMLYVNLDGRRGEIVAHPMQCRKLVKKERRRVWLREKNLQELFEPSADVHRLRVMIAASTENVWEDGVEFVEVKRKREEEKK